MIARRGLTLVASEGRREIGDGPERRANPFLPIACVRSNAPRSSPRCSPFIGRAKTAGSILQNAATGSGSLNPSYPHGIPAWSRGQTTAADPLGYAVRLSPERA